MNCLNCNQPVSNNYCAYCGQNAATQRFTFHHILSHDFIHGVFHLDKGFLFTLAELLKRPGHSVRDYITGKRTNHFNYFAFFVFVLTLGQFLKGMALVHVEDLFHTHVSKEIIQFNDQLIERFGKLFSFIIIPVSTLLNYFLFRNAKQNLAEHLVINLYKASGSGLIICLFYSLAIIFRHHTDLKHMYAVFSGLQGFYEFIFCFQYFSAFGYTRKELILRSLFVTLLIMALSVKKWVLLI